MKYKPGDKFILEIERIDSDDEKFPYIIKGINDEWRPGEKFLDTLEKANSDWIPFTMDLDKETGKWIVDGPLPDNNQTVMISDGKNVWEDTFVCDSENCWLDGSRTFLLGLAWQPKIEPHKTKG